jgi:hypothetical protein
MRRGLDFDKAEVALKRAAEKATHGTREERSGRFNDLYIERRSEGDDAVRRGGERVRGTKAGGKDKGRKP